jgi:hypothetical protein
MATPPKTCLLNPPVAAVVARANIVAHLATPSPRLQLAAQQQQPPVDAEQRCRAPTPANLRRLRAAPLMQWQWPGRAPRPPPSSWRPTCCAGTPAGRQAQAGAIRFAALGRRTAAMPGAAAGQAGPAAAPATRAQQRRPPPAAGPSVQRTVKKLPLGLRSTRVSSPLSGSVSTCGGKGRRAAGHAAPGHRRRSAAGRSQEPWAGCKGAHHGGHVAAVRRAWLPAVRGHQPEAAPLEEGHHTCGEVPSGLSAARQRRAWARAEQRRPGTPAPAGAAASGCGCRERLQLPRRLQRQARRPQRPTDGRGAGHVVLDQQVALLGHDHGGCHLRRGRGAKAGRASARTRSRPSERGGRPATAAGPAPAGNWGTGRGGTPSPGTRAGSHASRHAPGTRSRPARRRRPRPARCTASRRPGRRPARRGA